MFFTALFVLYLVLGTFLDGISMMMLTVPVLYPDAEGDGLLGRLVRRDPRDPGRARAAVAADRAQPVRGAIDRARRVADDDCVGVAALRGDAVRAVVSCCTSFPTSRCGCVADA